MPDYRCGVTKRSALVVAISLFSLCGAARSAAADAADNVAYRDLEVVARLACDEPVQPIPCSADGVTVDLAVVCQPNATLDDLEKVAACLKAPSGIQPSTKAALDKSAADGASRRGLSPTTIITDFFVARLKAELAYFVQRRISSLLCGGSDKEKAIGKSLMPQTCTLLSRATDLGLTGLPGTLREDLRGLPPRLVSLALQDVKAGSREQEALCVLEAGARAYPELRQGGLKKAVQFLASLAPAPQCSNVKLLKDLKLSAEVLLKLIEKLEKRGSEARTLVPLAVVGAAKMSGATLAAAHTLRAPERGELARRISAAAGSLTRGLETLFAPASDDAEKERERVARALDAVAEILAAVTVGDEPQRRDLVHALQAMSGFTDGRYGSALLHLQSISALDEWLAKGPLKRFWKAAAKFGPMIAGLAEAKDDEAAQKVLEAAAAPLGSYRAFRQEGGAVFLGGYAAFGVFGGEVGRDVNSSVVMAPMLPVGVELGWPTGKSSSFNVLFSVLDVGALAAVRFTDSGSEGMAEDGELKSEARDDLAGVLAPGIFASFGLGDSPFLAGAGIQYLPASRSVFDCPTDVLCSDTRAEPVVRGMLFFGVDLPVLAISQ